MNRVAYVKVADGKVVGFGETDDLGFAALLNLDPTLIVVPLEPRPAIGWLYDETSGALTPPEED